MRCVGGPRERWCAVQPRSTASPLSPQRPEKSEWRKYDKDTAVFRGGRRLRDYQLEGVNWMVWNWYQRRNCILADEMGLGAWTVGPRGSSCRQQPAPPPLLQAKPSKR